MLRVWAALAVSPVLLVVIALAVAAGSGSGDLWPHLLRFVLPQAVWETLLLLGGIGLFTVAAGTGTAWLVTCHRFPLRDLLSWALLLPLALPTYVAAYAWLDVMHPAGPVQMALRGALGLTDPRAIPLPEIRSLGGCVLVMGLVLYPYVYMAARVAFLTQGREVLRAGQAAGAGGLALFLRIGLPLARPAIAAGAALALMEALNDVGASEFLGVRSLTVSVYVTWITRSSLPGAAQIALLLLLLVLALLLLERWGRRHAAHAVAGAGSPELTPLAGLAGLSACLACALPVLLGFGVPAGYLAWAAGHRLAAFGLPPDLWRWMANSALLAAAACAVALPLALLLAFTARRDGSGRKPGSALLKLSMLGYALPGGVAAVGVIIALGWLDSLTAGLGALAPPLLSGSAVAVVAAYVIRFLAIPAGGLEAAYARLPREVDWSARSLGSADLRLLLRVHLPLLLPAAGGATLLLFLDAMKELPATLMLRPMNMETLATALYAEASRGTYEEGAVAALALAVIGLPPILVLMAAGRRAERRAATPRVTPGGVLAPALPTR
ncbi:ABC transporter permease [Teichococcus aerofrigidensis]